MAMNLLNKSHKRKIDLEALQDEGEAWTRETFYLNRFYYVKEEMFDVDD